LFKPFAKVGWHHLTIMDDILPNLHTNVTGTNVHQGTQLVTAPTALCSAPTTSTPASASSSSKRKLLEFDTASQSGIISGHSGTSGISGQPGQTSASKKQKKKVVDAVSAVGQLTAAYEVLGGKFDNLQNAQSLAAARLEQIVKDRPWLTLTDCYKLVQLIENSQSAVNVLAGCTQGSLVEDA
jgi:hypothetical protein